MNVSELSQAVHRFRWVDNRTIRVINNEGFERVFDIDEAMYENSFNAVPLFQNPEGYHYYFDQPILPLQNVADRLQRKYKAYKAVSLTNDFAKMDQKLKTKLIYRELFTVDY